MAKVVIKDLKKSEAYELLRTVQRNHCPGIAIQGSSKCRWINTSTVSATVRPTELEEGFLDHSVNTFEIYSIYWQESSLREFAGLD